MSSRILIVDDDEEDRELLCHAVKSINPAIECVEAVDGERGLAYLATCEQRPDYIFLDLNMPRISGLQVLERLKQHPLLKDIPIVIYTTSKTRSDQQKTRQLGAIHYITKPEKLSDLQQALRYVFERRWERSMGLNIL